MASKHLGDAIEAKNMAGESHVSPPQPLGSQEKPQRKLLDCHISNYALPVH